MQVDLSNQSIKLEQRSLVLLIQEHADAVHQQVSQQAIAQMPQIACPDPFDLASISQLPKDGVNTIADAPQYRALIRCSLGGMRFVERGQQHQTFASQGNLHIALNK